MTLLALAMARWRNRPRVTSAALAGLGFGIALLTKTAHLVLLPVVLLAAWLAARDRAPAPPRGRWMTHGLAAAGALALVLGLLAALNLARFGSPFETGYGREVGFWSAPWLEGLLGLLIGPGRGLLVYFPAVLLAAAGTPALVRRASWVAVLGWGGLATMLAVYCRWHAWEGGWCWGPRFLVPVLPLLAVPLAAWWETPHGDASNGDASNGVAPNGVAPNGVALNGVAPNPGRVARWGGVTLVAAGALFNWIGTLVPFTDYHLALKNVVGAPYMAVARWSWQAFPPRLYWQLPKTYWLLPAALRAPEARAIAIVLVAAGALGIAALVMAIRRARAATS